MIRDWLKIVGFSVACTNCGTITHGDKQTIELTSTPEHVEFLAEPSRISGTTPAKVELSRSVDHVITFSSNGRQRTMYVHRVQSYGTGMANAWNPVDLVGVGFMVDSATGAQYNLAPVSLHADLLNVPDDDSTIADSVVTFFNTNKHGPVVLALPNQEECKLQAGEYAVRKLKKGSTPITIYHWDVFKFEDKYEMTVDSNATFIALFSSIAGTHYALSNAVPDGFTESCKP